MNDTRNTWVVRAAAMMMSGVPLAAAQPGTAPTGRPADARSK